MHFGNLFSLVSLHQILSGVHDKTRIVVFTRNLGFCLLRRFIFCNFFFSCKLPKNIFGFLNSVILKRNWEHVLPHVSKIKLGAVCTKNMEVLVFTRNLGFALLRICKFSTFFFSLFLQIYGKSYPYFFTFATFTKGRWVYTRILDLIFRSLFSFLKVA